MDSVDPFDMSSCPTIPVLSDKGTLFIPYPDSIWAGSVSSPDIPSFKAKAHYYAGADLSFYAPWRKLIPSTVYIESYVDGKTVGLNLSNLPRSITADVSVVSMLADNDGKAITQFNMLFNTLIQQHCYGMVENVTGWPTDTMYMIPLEEGTNTKPEFLKQLEGHNIGDFVADRTLLLIFVINLGKSLPAEISQMNAHYSAQSWPPSQCCTVDDNTNLITDHRTHHEQSSSPEYLTPKSNATAPAVSAATKANPRWSPEEDDALERILRDLAEGKLELDSADWWEVQKRLKDQNFHRSVGAMRTRKSDYLLDLFWTHKDDAALLKVKVKLFPQEHLSHRDDHYERRKYWVSFEKGMKQLGVSRTPGAIVKRLRRLYRQ